MEELEALVGDGAAGVGDARSRRGGARAGRASRRRRGAADRQHRAGGAREAAAPPACGRSSGWAPSAPTTWTVAGCRPSPAARARLLGHGFAFEEVTIIGDTPLDVDCARACGARSRWRSPPASTPPRSCPPARPTCSSPTSPTYAPRSPRSPRPAVSLVVLWLHLARRVVWIGGLVYQAHVLLPAARRGAVAPSRRRPAAPAPSRGPPSPSSC